MNRTVMHAATGLDGQMQTSRQLLFRWHSSTASLGRRRSSCPRQSVALNSVAWMLEQANAFSVRFTDTARGRQRFIDMRGEPVMC